MGGDQRLRVSIPPLIGLLPVVNCGVDFPLNINWLWRPFLNSKMNSTRQALEISYSLMSHQSTEAQRVRIFPPLSLSWRAQTTVSQSPWAPTKFRIVWQLEFITTSWSEEVFRCPRWRHSSSIFLVSCVRNLPGWSGSQWVWEKGYSKVGRICLGRSYTPIKSSSWIHRKPCSRFSWRSPARDLNACRVDTESQR